MTTDSARPKQLGGYRLDRLLGRGGMGEVFLAWDTRLERHVAIKRILPDPPPDTAARTRFRREARAVARLSHPAIVQIYELLETDDGDDCLVMEYVEGRGLAERIAAGDLGLSDTLRLAGEIADGLADAHAKGLVHRDLKPENVRLTPSGRPKILDFGLARLLWSEGLDHSTLEKAVTQSGALIGTVHAMSPEQASGRPVDHRSDLFALGTLLYEMLAGRAPFRGLNVLDTLRRVTGEEPEPLAELHPGLPDDLVELVESLMAKDPADRPQNARLVVDALERLRGSGAGLGPEVEESAPRARPAAANPPPAGEIADLPTGEFPLPQEESATLETAIRTLVATELVDGDSLFRTLGDTAAAEVSARHDRRTRDLLARHGGLEVEKGSGFLLLFERPVAAIAWALAYHRALMELSAELSTSGVDSTGSGQTPELEARVAVHLGEVMLRHNPADDVSRGAKPIEVEGGSRPLVAHLLSLAQPRQTLLTHAVFDLGRRAAEDSQAPEQGGRWGEDLRWLAHGGYLFEGTDAPLEVYEVGVRGVAPLLAPDDSAKARRVVSVAGEQMLGWRPAPGQAIPRRPSWRLEERLGEGGFGEVWRAGHDSGEQRVFKFCFEAAKLRALQREVTLFRLLKESLGERDDIARVLDWNLESAPYFLEIEHTVGGDLVSWAGQQGGIDTVPSATRLELAAQVADALAAAHSVGVLHKDVKPANVLIRPPVDGGPPRVRLTDFGIGALIDRSRLDGSGVTALGFSQTLDEESSAAGTRRYLAPELLAGKPATVQADLYSLGVVLYQLAVGDLERPLAPGWQRDLDDPLLADDVARLVDGDPSRRPASADGVSSALRRLDARREERAQAARADQRRRRLRGLAVAAGILLAVALVLLIQAQRARSQAEALQRRAERAREEAEDLIAFMLGDLQENLQAVGRLDTLEGAGQKALDYFEGLEAREGNGLPTRTLAAHARALHQMGKVRMDQGDLDAALAHFQPALERSRALVSRDPENLDALFELGQSHFWVGYVHFRQQDLARALDAMESYLERSEELHHRRPDDDSLLEVAYGNNNVAQVLVELGETPLAARHYREALDISRQLAARHPESAPHQERWVRALLQMGDVHRHEGDLRQARERLDEALAALHDQLRRTPDNVRLVRQLSIATNRQATLALSLGDLATARRLRARDVESLEELHGVDPSQVEWRNQLGKAVQELAEVLVWQGELDPASATLDRAEDHARTLLAMEGGKIEGTTLLHRARILRAQVHRLSGRLSEAQRIAETVLAEDDPDHWREGVQARLTLAHTLAQAQRDHEARRWANEAGDIVATHDPDSRFYRTLDLRATSAMLAGDVAAARQPIHTLLGMGYRHPRFLEICRLRAPALCRAEALGDLR